MGGSCFLPKDSRAGLALGSPGPLWSSPSDETSRYGSAASERHREAATNAGDDECDQYARNRFRKVTPLPTMVPLQEPPGPSATEMGQKGEVKAYGRLHACRGARLTSAATFTALLLTSDAEPLVLICIGALAFIRAMH
ncbi:hypothetical protein EYF80_043409 [Liparis tanakae]|uniref:Uncharacterized protein n=1 Tax=Liparis tanakae TaxID=230148 RepID=A0A4Z2FYJ9_9TELE|nr:hypothetical protein EYF80_043409 [Liparis tanakae]